MHLRLRPHPQQAHPSGRQGEAGVSLQQVPPAWERGWAMPPGSYGTSCRFSFLSPNPDPTEGRELQPDTGTGRTWGDRPSLGTEASDPRPCRAPVPPPREPRRSGVTPLALAPPSLTPNHMVLLFPQGSPAGLGLTLGKSNGSSSHTGLNEFPCEVRVRYLRRVSTGSPNMSTST